MGMYIGASRERAMKREEIILSAYSFNRMAKFTGMGLFEPYKIDIRQHIVNR